MAKLHSNFDRRLAVREKNSCVIMSEDEVK